MRRIHTCLLLGLLIGAIAFPTMLPAQVVVDSTVGTYIRAITFHGNYALCAVRTGIMVLDVTDPALPTYAARLNLGTGRSGVLTGHFRIPVQGIYAYVPLWDNGLYVIDVSNPEIPVEVAHLVTPHPVRSVALDGNYAYAVGGDNIGPMTIDISDPLNPALVATDTSNLQGGLDITVVGDVAYMAANWFYTFDVSDPLNVAVLGLSMQPVLAHAVKIKDEKAYLIDLDNFGGGLGGLGVYSVADPGNPLLLGSAGTHQDDKDVTLVGSFAYVANNTGGIHAVNISDVANPQVVKCYSGVSAVPCGGSFGAPTEDVTVHPKGYLYASANFDGLIIYALDARGDVVADGELTAADLIFLVNYVFKSGTAPTPVELGNTNCLGPPEADAADVIYLVNHVFKGGDPPLCP